LKIEEEIKQSKFSSAHEKAIINLLYTSNAIEDAFKAVLKSYDISLPQYNVLRILRGRKEGFATCGDLKQVMLDKNPDVTRLCDKLVLKKLIQRNNNKSNRRQILLKISEGGLKALDDIDPYFRAVTSQLTQIPESELEQLSDTLDKLRDCIKK
jgi:DNA-binding MarR family transcriptional regulator